MSGFLLRDCTHCRSTSPTPIPTMPAAHPPHTGTSHPLHGLRVREALGPPDSGAGAGRQLCCSHGLCLTRRTPPHAPHCLTTTRAARAAALWHGAPRLHLPFDGVPLFRVAVSGQLKDRAGRRKDLPAGMLEPSDRQTTLVRYRAGRRHLDIRTRTAPHFFHDIPSYPPRHSRRQQQTATHAAAKLLHPRCCF